MQPAQLLLWVVLLALATWISALYAAREVTVARTRRRRLEKRLAGEPDRVKAIVAVDRELGAELLVARFGGVMAAALGGFALAGAGFWIAQALSGFGRAGAAIAGAIAFLLGALILVVFGQLLPRTLAAGRPADRAPEQGPVTRLASAVLWPAAAAASWATGALLALTGKSKASGRLTDDELNLLLLSSYRLGGAGGAQRELIGRVFGYAEDRVRDAMTPKSDMVTVSSSMRVREALDVVRHVGFTRFPVCEGGPDRVIGIVHLRDLIDAQDWGGRAPVTDVMRPCMTLQADQPVSEALAAMQQNRSPMAIVADDSGAVLGLVTVEDIVARLVREPAPRPPREVRMTAKGVYEFGGDQLIEDVEDALDIDLGHAGLQSIGGYLTGKFGRRPREGDSIKLAGYVFDVLEVRGARIATLRAQRSKEATTVTQGGEHGRS